MKLASDVPADDFPSIAPLPTAEPELELLPELLLEEIDPSEVVEAAEQLLREGASHDFDLVVIGAGPGGLACAHRAAQGGLDVAIVEAREIGGVCLNRGCIPTKTLLESARVLQQARHSDDFGTLIEGTIRADWVAIQARKTRIVEQMRERTQEQLETANITIIQGKAHFVDGHTLQVEGTEARQITAVHIVIATGGQPARLPIPGLDSPGVLTSDDILELSTVPASLLVIGAGAVGVEFAQLFAEVGSQVTLLDRAARALPEEEADISDAICEVLKQQNIDLVFGAELESIVADERFLTVKYNLNEVENNRHVEKVLLASGRRANIEALRLENAGIKTEKGKITVNEENVTNVSGVWAIGDCVRHAGWAHQAALEGRHVADCILGITNRPAAHFVPSCYYTLPEIATVGLSEQQARDLGIEVEVAKCSLENNARAATQSSSTGFVKLVCAAGTKRILGAGIVGARATEIINEIALAIKRESTAYDLADAMHVYPSFADALQTAAGSITRI